MLQEFLNISGKPAPRGTAIIIAMVLVLLFAGLSVVLMNEMLSRSLRVEIAQEDLLAFEAAEAGVDAAINDINIAKTVRLLKDGNGKYCTEYDTNKNPDSTNIPGSPYIAPFSVVLTNDGHPIFVHRWVYYPTIAPDLWVRPGCLGTRFWRPLTTPPILEDGTVNPAFTTVGSDNLIPSGPLGVSYVSRPMWKSFLAPTFGANTTNLTGAPMAHEDRVTPLSLGDTAFFTYAVDWLHDGKDNNPLPGDPVPAPAANIDDPSERNKYTVYSTGIHLGFKKAGVSEYGTTVTLEVNLNAKDYDSPIVPSGPLELFP